MKLQSAEISYYIIAVMRRMAAWLMMALAAVGASACSARELLQQYEYEEDVYLSLDGTATVYVNASVAALNTLRGASFDPRSNAPFDRARAREFYTSPLTRDVRVTTSRRRKRVFVHVRLNVEDVRSLGKAAPFAWSRYRFDRDGDFYVFQQRVGPVPGNTVAESGWTGRESVAFRVHLPSRIEYHNAGPGNPKRGNILVWEQPLVARLRGEPLMLDARMQTQSILYRTLGLFGATLAVVALLFAFAIAWIWRRGARAPAVMKTST